MSENIINRNIIIGKAGGTAGKQSVNYKVSLPAPWMDKMGIKREDRSVFIEFNEKENSIIIKKKED